jgi:hypothetical protein
MDAGSGHRQPSSFSAPGAAKHNDGRASEQGCSAWDIAEYRATVGCFAAKGLSMARYYPAIVEKASEGYGV